MHAQVLAVVINASFVVYQGWSSSALNVFACQVLDDGKVDDSEPEYYALFQRVRPFRGIGDNGSHTWVVEDGA